MLLKALLCGLAAYAAELLIEAGFAAAQRYIPGVAPSWVTDNWVGQLFAAGPCSAFFRSNL